MSELIPPEGTLLATVNGVEYRLLHAVFAVRRRKWTPYCSEQDWNHSSVAADVRRQERIAELEAELATLKGPRPRRPVAPPTNDTHPPAASSSEAQEARARRAQAMTADRHPCPTCERSLSKNNWRRHVANCGGTERTDVPAWPGDTPVDEPAPAEPPRPKSMTPAPIATDADDPAPRLGESALRTLAVLRALLPVDTPQHVRIQTILDHPHSPGLHAVYDSFSRLQQAGLMTFEAHRDEARGYTITLLPAALAVELPDMADPPALSVDEARSQLSALEDEKRDLCSLRWRTVAQIDRLKVIAKEKRRLNDALRRAKACARQPQEADHAAAV